MKKNANLLSFFKDNPKFFLLWFSQIFSQITINMINFVMAARIFEKTGSTLAVSFLWVFFYLPSLFLGPFAGFFSDVFERKRVLQITNLSQAAIVLLYLLVGDRLYPIYTIVFLYSLVNQFYFPAEAASIPSLVRKEYLSTANSLFLFTAQSALAIGFGLGGVFLKLFGNRFPVVFTATTLFLAALSVSFLPIDQRRKQISLKNLADFWTNIKTGYLYIRDTPVILFPLSILIFFQILVVVLGVSLPELATKLLEIEVAAAGPLLVFPLGLGALAGVVIINRFLNSWRKKKVMGIGLMSITVILLTLSQVVPRLTDLRLGLTVALMVFLGLSAILVFVPNQTLVQEKTPPELRGRVFGALGFIGTLATLPCLLFSATVVELLGVKTFFLAVSVMVFALLVLIEKVELVLLSRFFRFKNAP